MHTGERELVVDDFSEQCQGSCCGHYTDHTGRRWHRCTLWVGVCVCKTVIG